MEGETDRQLSKGRPTKMTPWAFGTVCSRRDKREMRHRRRSLAFAQTQTIVLVSYATIGTALSRTSLGKFVYTTHSTTCRPLFRCDDVTSFFDDEQPKSLLASRRFRVLRPA